MNQYLEYRERRRRGFSLIELLLVIAVLGVVATMVMPAIGELRARSGLRSARTLFVSSLATARSAAVQKGKTARLTLTGGALAVTAMSGLRATPIQIQGPVYLARITGASFAALRGAPTEIVYDARGLITPAINTVARYELRVGALTDTVCITGAGHVMAKGCVL